jgi:RimJ/RimL family protein N-acetyltransferase
MRSASIDTATRFLIETKRLNLHATTVGDAELLLAVWNDPAYIRHVTDRGIRTVRQARGAIKKGAQRLFRDFGYGPYCVSLKSDGSMIGICGLFRRPNLLDPDIGFGFLPEFCSQGYAFEAAESVLAYARDTLGIALLNALVSPENNASIRLIDKLGLTFDRMITMPGERRSICLYSAELKGKA